MINKKLWITYIGSHFMTRFKFLYKNEVFKTIRSVSDMFSIPYGKLCHKLNEITTDTTDNTIDITQLVDNYRKFHNFNSPVLSVKGKHFKTYNSIAKFLHVSENTAKRVTPENFDSIHRERLAKLQPIVINGKTYKRLSHVLRDYPQLTRIKISYLMQKLDISRQQAVNLLLHQK